MMSRKSSWRSGLASAISILALTNLVACDALTGNNEPENALINIDSPDLSQVTLIVSDNFREDRDPACPDPECPVILQLVTADTMNISLPFSESYPLPRLMIYAETFPIEPVDATISMSVRIDDREPLEESRRLLAMDANGEQETLRIVYRYTIPTLPGG